MAVLLLAVNEMMAMQNRAKAEYEKGQSLVEIAIFLSILLVLLVGVIQVAVAVNAYLVVVNATREGARYSVGDFNRTNAEIAAFTKGNATALNLNASNATIIVTRVDTVTTGGGVISLTGYVSTYEPTLGVEPSRFNQTNVLARLDNVANKIPGNDEFVIVEFFYSYPFFMAPVSIPMYSYTAMRVVGN